MKKILLSIISKVYALFCYAIPVNKNCFAFYPLHDLSKLSGNIRSMALYIKENHKGIIPVIITKNEKVIKEAEIMGIKSSKPFFGFSLTLLRAEFIFLDSNWFPYLFNPKTSVIQLWHGVGFKNIALLDDNLTEEEKEKFEFYYQKYALLISSSDNDKKKKAASFHSPNIVITGSPRNDIFFSSSNYFEKIKKKYHLKFYYKVITYAPTFRDYETTKPFSDAFWYKLQQHLEKTNQLFVIKKHPMDQYFAVPTKYANIRDMSNIISDTQELLMITDLLISDYSSISTDFVLTERPILSYVYDLDSYKMNCRSIYYDLEETLPKPFINTEDELLRKIIDQKWVEETYYIESYNKFRTIFHKYPDGDSCRRVMDEVLKLRCSQI